MTQIEPKQLSFECAVHDAFTNDETKADVYCHYDVRKLPKGGHGLHILPGDAKHLVAKNDVINVYATPRNVLKTGGQVEYVKVCEPEDITLGEFEWWNYQSDEQFNNGKTLNTLKSTLNLQKGQSVTCIKYRSLAL